MKTSAKFVDRLLLKNGCANFINSWVVDAIQLESAKSDMIPAIVAELQHHKNLQLLSM